MTAEIKSAAKQMIIRNMPEALRREFKARCAAEGVPMQDKIVELIEYYLNVTCQR